MISAFLVYSLAAGFAASALTLLVVPVFIPVIP